MAKRLTSHAEDKRMPHATYQRSTDGDASGSEAQLRRSRPEGPDKRAQRGTARAGRPGPRRRSGTREVLWVENYFRSPGCLGRRHVSMGLLLEALGAAKRRCPVPSRARKPSAPLARVPLGAESCPESAQPLDVMCTDDPWAGVRPSSRLRHATAAPPGGSRRSR